MTPETLQSIAQGMCPKYKWSFAISLEEPQIIHGYVTFHTFRNKSVRTAYAHQKIFKDYPVQYYAHMIEEMKITLDEQIEKMGLVGWKTK